MFLVYNVFISAYSRKTTIKMHNSSVLRNFLLPFVVSPSSYL